MQSAHCFYIGSSLCVYVRMFIVFLQMHGSMLSFYLFLHIMRCRAVSPLWYELCLIVWVGNMDNICDNKRNIICAPVIT